MKIYPYKSGSKSAKALAEEMGIKRIKHEGPPVAVDVLINWGAGNIKRNVDAGLILNEPQAVKTAANKLKTLLALKLLDVPIPKFTQDKAVAINWLLDGQCKTVVVRHVLNGHSGEGIELVKDRDKMPDAPLYTQYIHKHEEFRVHVAFGRVIFLQRKARKKDVPDENVNWKIRNHVNGFIFAHKGVIVPQSAQDAAVLAVRCLGLDFGAVDVIYNADDDKSYVLEVNTACGLEGETVKRYAQSFKQLYEGYNQ